MISHQMIVSCPICDKKVSIKCREALSIIEHDEGNMLVFSLLGSVRHDCTIGE